MARYYPPHDDTKCSEGAEDAATGPSTPSVPAGVPTARGLPLSPVPPSPSNPLAVPVCRAPPSRYYKTSLPRRKAARPRCGKHTRDYGSLFAPHQQRLPADTRGSFPLPPPLVASTLRRAPSLPLPPSRTAENLTKFPNNMSLPAEPRGRAMTPVRPRPPVAPSLGHVSPRVRGGDPCTRRTPTNEHRASGLDRGSRHSDGLWPNALAPVIYLSALHSSGSRFRTDWPGAGGRGPGASFPPPSHPALCQSQRSR